MERHKISRFAFIMMIASTCYITLWTIEYLARLLANVFSQNWASWPIVDDSLQMGVQQYAVAAAFFLPVIIVAWGSYVCTMVVLGYFRKSEYFGERQARALKTLGLFLLGVAVVDTYVGAFELRMYTLWNSPYSKAPI